VAGRYLLDTHALLWMATDSSRLGATAAQAIADPANDIHLSHVSVWEMAIKSSIGKLSLSIPLERLLREQVSRNSLSWLEIRLPHLLRVEHLPRLHRDPFDRLLVCQAICEGLTLLSADEVMNGYPVDRVW